MIFLWMPETKQRTLEELDYVFAVPTSVFIKYNTTKVVPWWFRHYILWQHDATLEPLYRFDMQDDHSSTGTPSIVVDDHDHSGTISDAGATIDTRESDRPQETSDSAIATATGAEAVTIFSQAEGDVAALRRFSWHGSGTHRHPTTDSPYST